MTRRETRKTRSERRSRIEAEGLESRNLLSGVGVVGTPDLEVHLPHMTLTPEVRVAHFVPPGPMTMTAKVAPEVRAVDFDTGCKKVVADVKKAPAAKFVADIKLGFHPHQPVIPTGPASQILIGLHPTKAVVDGPYQTSVWGGIESVGAIKKA
jgi:hypothetical protein